jgi:hypothetical protein
MENKQSDIMQTYFFDYTFEFTIMTLDILIRF